ncbi:hypothetical protein [Nocardia camponoti]|uniref:DUF445 family protein n=1 Tax=Nocardia camponoti TaxID=1616106 RepID=A0A917V4S3_9NOCA|nr:hypothetical protein [Nocardia camponoti]GGK36456.1 hypothetical protein GCM10011591_05110 [Nocardia camponoti]
MNAGIEAAGFFGRVDWEHTTGLSKFWVDMISIPIFSALAGLLTNYTGVIMLFAPVRFTGFYVPGLKTIFPFLPRKVQILPTFAPGGMLGFQGFIPARSEKMASLMVDNAVAKIGTAKDFFDQMDPRKISAQVARVALPNVRAMVDSIMTKEHPQLWADMPPRAREVIYSRVEAELPAITDRAFDFIGANIDQLLDVKLMVVGYLRRRPELLKDVIYGLGAPELRFMTRSGLLGFPFGVIVALWLSLLWYTRPHDGREANITLPSWLDAVIHFVPAWLWVLIGGAVVGVLVNIIAIKVVFEPATPGPRWKYPWGVAKFAKRQHQAAADLGHAIGYQIVTLDVVTEQLLEGPSGDKTRAVIAHFLKVEIDRILGPMRSVTRLAVGPRRFDAIQATAGASLATEMKPWLVDDVAFSQSTAASVDRLATEKLRELPPGEFVEMLYTSIEQDAWLLYLHGGVLGAAIGALHLVIFGV